MAKTFEQAIEMDFAKLELRYATTMSKPLEDIHTARAMELTGLPKEQITPTMRNIAKEQNYILWYSTPSGRGKLCPN